MSRFPRPGRTPRPRPVPTAGPTPTPSPTPGPGTTFTLTTNIETVPATGVLPANSTVTGVIATTSTYQTGDIINANQTSDVKITVANGGTAEALVAINNARSVQFRNVSTSQTVNAVLFSGVSDVGSYGSLANGDIVITNGDIASRYVLSNPTAQSAGVVADLSVGFLNATGAADTAKFSVENVGFFSATSGVTNASLTVTGNTAEAATVATAGTNFFRPTIGTAATALTFTGSGNNEVTLAAGDLTNNAKTVSFATASGVNALNLGSFVRTADRYIGGTGTDSLAVTPAGLGATSLNVSAFENFALQSGSTDGTLGFASAPNFSRVDVLAGTGDATITLLNAGQIPTIRFVGAGTAAQQNFNGLTAATTSSTVNVAFSNGTATATDYEIGVTTAKALTLDGASTINLSISGTASDASSLDGDTIQASGLVNFSASGTGSIGNGTKLTLDNAATTQSLQLVNLSGLTGTTTISKVEVASDSFVALTVNASAGGTTFTTAGAEASTDVLTINGGAGVDNYTTTTFLGLLNFTGGASGDTVSANNTAGGVVFAQGGAGNDALTGGSSADTLQGDADDDIISGRVGRDIVSGGTGVDAFRYQESLSTDIDTITDFAFGSTGDNVGYKAGQAAGFTSGTTPVTLVNGAAAAVSASDVTNIATFGGGAGITAGTATNFIQLTNVSATSFSDAIGANGVDFGTGTISATASVSAVYFDSANQQAVFGFITNTNGSTGDTLNNSDTFTEIARASTTSTAFLTLGTANVDFF